MAAGAAPSCCRSCPDPSRRLIATLVTFKCDLTHDIRKIQTRDAFRLRRSDFMQIRSRHSLESLAQQAIWPSAAYGGPTRGAHRVACFAPSCASSQDSRAGAACSPNRAAKRATGEGATRRIRPRATCVVRPQPLSLQPAKCGLRAVQAKGGGVGLLCSTDVANTPLSPRERGRGVRVRRRRCVLTASAGLQSEACNQRTHSHRRPTSSTIALDHCGLQRMAPCA
ncbi:hypothetical protein LMG31886_00690 [Xanthomonas hydrangeae]|nr:hypothetical protein LMG31886_00690 [Xanthomonas hydrangeae]CAD7719897.1 hypothetical protein LMG31886_00690 [Xanthomonas hydrangeae]CAD7730409.1 hypothetical protein LMG31885_14800 [Xanthomonas hydrangeae]CAD7730413.1 hypothetical protein LMG31885_14800 [Xanthomonas hydrangeae]